MHFSDSETGRRTEFQKHWVHVRLLMLYTDSLLTIETISGIISKWNGTECISSNFRSVKRARRLSRPVQFTGQTRWLPAWPLASCFGA